VIGFCWHLSTVRGAALRCQPLTRRGWRGGWALERAARKAGGVVGASSPVAQIDTPIPNRTLALDLVRPGP
jgi:hypothetical protein